MYRIEIFDQSMNYVSACYTDDAQTISLDYLAFDPFQLTIQLVEAQKGYFCHITKENNTVADCIISDVKPGKETQQISLRPLQAVFDAEVYYSPVYDAITWLAQTLNDQYVTNSDTLQRRPLNITSTPGGRNFPLTGYNFDATMNILSVITTAFRTWGVVTEAYLDLVNKQIIVNIFEQTATKVIECDLENVISSEVTLGDSYGSTNKLIIKKTVAEGTPSGTTEITYYRHNDGTIDTTDSDRIVPVFWQVTTLEQTEDMTEADWIAETATMAQEALTPAKYDNEVVISVWEDDMIVRPKEIALGTITELHIKGTDYYSILTGEEIEGNVYTLTFGAVRTELTKKLSIQGKRTTSSSSSSGGGGGGGDVPIATTTTPGIVMPDGTTITVELDGTIHAVGGGGGGSATIDTVLLWENTSPTSNFSAQTISVNVSAYTMFVVDYKATVNVDNHLYSSIQRESGETITTTLSSVGDNASVIRTRALTISDTGFTFANATYWGSYGQASGESQTGQIIPRRIWGLVLGSSASPVSYFKNQTVSVASSAEILRITDPKITTASVVLECTFANPSAISGTVSWTSYNGYISFTGTCTTSTTANVTLSGASFNELHPIGSVICKSTNVNPSADYGGTWELIDKQFKYQQWLTASSSDIFTAESSTTVGTLCVTLHDHFISIERMAFSTTSAIGDSTVNIGTFKFSSLGVVDGALKTTKSFVAQSDGGNGIAMMAITTSGLLETLDRVTVTSGGTIAAGNSIIFTFDIPLRMAEMDDSYCDKFFFKRTA